MIRDSDTARALREAADERELRGVIKRSVLAEFWRD